MIAARVGIAASMLCCALALAADEPIETQGQAPVQLGDRLRAKQRALEDAMRIAVEQAAIAIDPQVAKRPSDLKLRILPKARTFIASYRIIEERELDGVFVVRLSSTVASSRLAMALSPTRPIPLETVKARSTRRLNACLSLRVDGAPVSQREYDSAESELRRVLDERLIELTFSSASNGCDENALIATAAAQRADLILYGIVDLKPAGLLRGTAKLGVHAEMTVRLRQGAGDVLAQRELADEGYGADAEQARASAFSHVLARAINQLDAFLGNAHSQTPASGIVVRMLNVRRHAEVDTVACALESITGVQKVEPRTFIGADVELLVTTELEGEQLAAALSRAPVGGARLLVEPSGKGRVNVRLVASEATPQ